MIPKFRAWDKKHKQMIRVISLNWYEEITDYNVVGLFPNTESVARFWDETIVMQSAGLKDKNGVEIYEGDIVILCWSDEVGESHWGKVTIKNPFEYTPEESRYFIYSDGIEVIGNIYENPELLEARP